MYADTPPPTLILVIYYHFIYEVINIWSFCLNRDVRGQGY
jgi:hypothetical protein